MSTTHSTRPGARLGLATVAVSLIAAPLVLAAPAAADEPAPGEPLITSEGTTWRFHEDGTEPQGDDPDVLAWVEPGFDDGAWRQGTGSFGALRGAIGQLSGGYVPATLINHYLDGVAAPSVPTYFFRTTVELDADAIDRLVALEGAITFDDAVRVYINGELVYNFRDERASNPAVNQQYAGDSRAAPYEGTFRVEADQLPDGTLTPGANTVAVALYQDRASSSDIYLDFVSLVPILGPATQPGEYSQQLQVTLPQIGDGEFVWTIDGSNDIVDLGIAEENGDHFAASGSLNPVRVTDTRTGGPSWAISGQVSDFSFSSSSEVIEGKYLGWTPSVSENTGGAEAGDPVQSGLVSGDGLAVPAVLGSADEGHALGSALLGADLDLRIPLTVGEGTYAATLTLTALS